MKPGGSLLLRLVLLTTAAVAVVWLVTAAFTWRSALHEVEELLNHPPATASHMQEERADLARDIAEHLLTPMLYALPGLALVLLVAVGISLRPLRRIADDVAARAPNRLTPIADSDTPREILPLVQRLNDLFAGIDRALENERRFTADASHELRTPLAALKAHAQVALAATDETERRHALDQILVGCDRATHLLTQLLTLARLDADSGQALQPLALRPIAADVLADAAGEAIARHCELVLADGDARVRGDVALLQAMLRNLVDNALRHATPSRIEVAVEQQGHRAVLSVRDDGKGIPEAEIEAVQQRFRRGASADSSAALAGNAAQVTDVPGSGLGLSIVRRIAELHGGSLLLEHGPDGRGLVVSLHLPAIN
jgi:signal transduction histidine kinase